MIGKQIVGRSFRGALSYVAGKEGARKIGGNMAGETVDDFVSEFRVSEALNAEVARTVYHVSLSVPPSENLSDRTWRQVVRKYLDGMGFGESQYVAYRHTDTDEEHVHAIASRIRITDGSCVRDSWNYRRSEALLRSIEHEFGLTPAPSSRDKRQRSPKTPEVRLMRRTGKESKRVAIQKYVETALRKHRTHAEFTTYLESKGIEVRYRYAEEKIVGVSFALDGVAFQGRQLGRDFSWPGLRRVFEGAPLNLPDTDCVDIETGEDLSASHERVGSGTLSGNEDRKPEEVSVNRRRRELRERYIRYERIARERLALPSVERRILDVAIAILVMREFGNRTEAEDTLSQGDGVWAILAKGATEGTMKEALSYIQEATEEAEQRLEEREQENLAIER